MRLIDVKKIYNTGIIAHRPIDGHNRLCNQLKNKCITMMRSGMRNIDVCKKMGVSVVTMSSWRKEV